MENLILLVVLMVVAFAGLEAFGLVRSPDIRLGRKIETRMAPRSVRRRALREARKVAA